MCDFEGVETLELFNVITVEQAKKIVSGFFETCQDIEKVSIFDCLGRVVSKDIIANFNVPHFKRSTVDGYAICSKDAYGASEAIPSIMNLIDDIEMGEEVGSSIQKAGDCFYVPTGGMIPDGADAVVMIEHTNKMDDRTILINSEVAPGDNIVTIGEDVSKGEVVIKKGTKLRPYEIGVLSGIGCSDIDVFKRPKIAVISTGDEIVSCDEQTKAGQIRDINTYLLHALIIESSAEPICYGIVRDEYDELKSTVSKALVECDCILISGGSSVGNKDQTLKVLKSFEDSEVLAHGIAIKPGKPTIICKVNTKPVFGLPGHPLAAAIIYKLIVESHINSIMNFKSDESYPITCKFSVNYHKSAGREECIPVIVRKEDADLIAEPIFTKSGLITGFSKAWGYVRVEKDVEGLYEGQTVNVYKL